jgi:hypothetical protein
LTRWAVAAAQEPGRAGHRGCGGDADDTIVPRLVAAGADRDRVCIANEQSTSLTENNNVLNLAA